jgi:hypothetical protein
MAILAYNICRIVLCSRPFYLPPHHATDLQINHEIPKTRPLANILDSFYSLTV